MPAENGEDNSYFLVQNLGSVEETSAVEEDASSDELPEVVSGPGVLWRIWLRLPPLLAGERSVRVRAPLNACSQLVALIITSHSCFWPASDKVL